MGKKAATSPRLRRLKKPTGSPPPIGVGGGGGGSPPNSNNNGIVVKGKKKTGGARLWMKMDQTGRHELVELDKNAIIRRASIPARDLRILGPVFSQSSNILGTITIMLLSNFLNFSFIQKPSFFFNCDYYFL